MDQVCQVYFQYKASSKTELQVRETEYYHTIVFCPQFIDLFNRSRHREFGLLPYKPQINQELFDELSSLTVKPILQLTSTTDLIARCEVRDDNLSDVVFMNSSECHQFFKILKAVNGERICYIFMPRNKTKYSVGNAASSVFHLNSAYHLFINSLLGNKSLCYIISHFVDSDNFKEPLHSRMFGAKMYNEETFVQSGFVIYGQETEIYRLSHPYDTKCTPGHDRQICHEDCLTPKFLQVNRATGSAFHHNPLDFKIMSQKDYENKSLKAIATSAFNDCHLCRIQTECYTRFSKTFVTEHKSKELVIRSMIPSGAFTSINTVPLLTLIEYIVQVGSCIGVWFGLSFVSLHPTKWKNIIKHKLKTKKKS